MSAETIPAELARLVGQHPAALRAVCWTGPRPADRSRDHLEIETKHGRVVVIDPESGAAFANPPLPPRITPGSRRQQRDLTELVPAAFNDRPVITAVEMLLAGGRTAGWRVHLSTGIALTLKVPEVVPQVSRAEQPPPRP
ncbi:MAG: hypothetical protein AB7I04_13790 [Pseudomonadales bacterium]